MGFIPSTSSEGYFFTIRKMATICKKLETYVGIKVNRRGVAKSSSHVKASGSIEQLAGSGKQMKHTANVKAKVEQAIKMDDKTTALQIIVLLNATGYSISLYTILRYRKSFGWTFKGSAHCLMIQEMKKAKHLEWATQQCTLQ